MDPLTLQQRAASIFETTTSLATELAQTGHPEPSFEHGLPPHLYGDAPESKAGNLKYALLQMVDELHALLTEPAQLLVPEMRLPTLSVHPLVRLGIAENFPEQGTSVAYLANSLNLRESVVRRLLKHSATHHVFYEARPDFYIHTAASRHLAQNQGMRDWVCVGAEEVLPGTLKIADALVKYPDSEEPEHCGWNLANNTTQPVFRALATSPTRAAGIANAMNWLAKNSGFSPGYLAQAFPWGPVSDSGEPFKIVDVGGSLGHISRALAAHSHPAAGKAEFIVQDLPDIVAQGTSDLLPSDLQGRVRFEAHDFFTEQPVVGADVYLLRLILHDWSDKYAVLILRALIPALKRGAKVVLNERVVPGFHQVHYLVERDAREFDMHMLGFQNARERTRDDWEGLLKEADGRFKLTAVRQPAGSFLAVVEVTWLG
ncbi:O-methyltransferase-domain-containing protein [Aspergillus cavernicola]|uniref:O-methyltransferase-domain-containing protein n=1 Tax=Aspergillus cavernicola TaxID=176166 RepID=A0ABR4IDE1_9EURO